VNWHAEDDEEYDDEDDEKEFGESYSVPNDTKNASKKDEPS